MIPNTDAVQDMCCKLSSTDFLNSKFWKKTESRFSFGSYASTNRGSLPIKEFCISLCNFPTYTFLRMYVLCPISLFS